MYPIAGGSKALSVCATDEHLERPLPFDHVQLPTFEGKNTGLEEKKDSICNELFLSVQVLHNERDFLT
jgi:hypothetical protein